MLIVISMDCSEKIFKENHLTSGLLKLYIRTYIGSFGCLFLGSVSPQHLTQSHNIAS